jgi:RNA polymerase sigma-70 factor, ECF subfamily
MNEDLERKPPDRHELVTRARGGDVAAFEQLVAPMQPFLIALARGRLGDDHLAHDALQDALLQAWRRIGDLQDANALRSWLATILQRTCGKMRERQTNRREVELKTEMDPPAVAPARDDTDRFESLRKIVMAQDDETQQLLAMRYSENLSYAEIAAALNISEDAVRGRLFYARELIRKRMGAK